LGGGHYGQLPLSFLTHYYISLNYNIQIFFIIIIIINNNNSITLFLSTASAENITDSISDSTKKIENKKLHSDDGMYFYYKTIKLINLNFLYGFNVSVNS